MNIDKRTIIAWLGAFASMAFGFGAPIMWSNAPAWVGAVAISLALGPALIAFVLTFASVVQLQRISVCIRSHRVLSGLATLVIFGASFWVVFLLRTDSNPLTESDEVEPKAEDRSVTIGDGSSNNVVNTGEGNINFAAVPEAINFNTQYDRNMTVITFDVTAPPPSGKMLAAVYARGASYLDLRPIEGGAYQIDDSGTYNGFPAIILKDVFKGRYRLQYVASDKSDKVEILFDW
ncbi:MAG: hypothetical protein GXP06_13590 [Alphaproteobacteria bacterium]|nr:hypothetical protein [Alphaproteobacteria bacterium]